MWQPTIQACEHCDEVVFQDVSGVYDATENPGGYGGGTNPDDPSDFTTYTLEVWKQGSDHNADPDYTLNLLNGGLPTPDANGNYSWTITLANLGVTHLQSGIWYFKVTVVWNGAIITSDYTTLFVTHLSGLLDTEQAKVDPSCACTEGCMSTTDMLSHWTATQHIACCGYSQKADADTQWIYANYKSCC